MPSRLSEIRTVAIVSETHSRTFASFRERELVRVSGKVITVIDPPKLEQLLRRNLGDL